ncbi:hypothetical protein JCM16303_000023 [Sporobolomyces ruberrimus]
MPRRAPDDDYYDLSSGSSSDSPSENENREFVKRRPKASPPASASSGPYLIIGVVLVILAAIAATTYVLTREGGAFDGAKSESSTTPTAAVAEPPTPPSAVSTASSGGGGYDASDSGDGEGGSEDEEGEGSKPKPSKPTETSESDDPKSSPTSSGKPSSGGISGGSLSLDFTTLSSGDELESYLAEKGLRISTDFIDSEPMTHTFKKENVDWVDGAMRLIVKGQSGSGDISSSEIATTDSFLYGRVTTRMKASDVPGVCHGIFWYTASQCPNDNLEVDIELLTSYYTDDGGDLVKPGLQLTNQALVKKQPSTNEAVPYGFDPTADFHDYTIEWKEGESIFEVDGVEVGRLTENVPSEPMAFIWNSWSNGDLHWSAGPPADDSYMLISAIAANWTVAKGS